jgi:hypothetical protein
MWNSLEVCAKPAPAMHLRGNRLQGGAMGINGLRGEWKRLIRCGLLKFGQVQRMPAPIRCRASHGENSVSRLAILAPFV